MLERLTQKMGDIVRQISGKASITEKNIEDAVEAIKIALLEADVNVRVVRRFVNGTIEEAKGEKVLRSVTPGQQFVKIVHDRLTALLGDSRQDIVLKDGITVIMLVGLQGSGKTTTAAKLGNYFKNKNKRVLLAACDLVRPAAVDQLVTLGTGLGIAVHTNPMPADSAQKNPLPIAKAALERARKELFDVVIIDTTGRLQIDDAMMQELVAMKTAIKPDEVLLVADAMTGQTAVDIATTFDEKVGLTGVILSKFDSDTRGGAALSIKSITGKPIKFVGISEKPDGLEPFYPDRMANRILGMGDIVSLVEKAQSVIEEQEALELEQKLRKETFTLEDYLQELRRFKKMGSMKQVLDMMPGLAGQISEDQIDENQLKRNEAIILSMTKKERLNHLIIGPTRRSRIARGSGTSVAEVAKLLKDFEKTRSMMKKMVKNKKMLGGFQ
ncbi:MAG TPA: signal recognition particle protein [Spirochaetales bacterium]|nr:signal recognition particle protein [Spirochaetales bacterium]HPD80322.1 signal recognition particle protein [Spirochaetales bacterium]HQK34198.1 signal recognition particle protein [Spirochaetales bacterium]HRV28956.1 signal recognition particle protein [Spirochaetia bacterium]